MEISIPSSSCIPTAISGMGRGFRGIRGDAELFKCLAKKRHARMAVSSINPILECIIARRPNRNYCVWPLLLLGQFDLAKRNISTSNMTLAKVSWLDSNQRPLLEVFHRAFESAGETDFKCKLWRTRLPSDLLGQTHRKQDYHYSLLNFSSSPFSCFALHYS